MNKPIGTPATPGSIKQAAEERYSRTVDGVYFSHQPIYGYRSPYSSPSNISRYIILHSIFRNLSRYKFNSFLDVGGAEGWTTWLVKKTFGCYAMNSDLSHNAVEQSRKLFNLPAVACSAGNLTFSCSHFDAVLCSETLEHLSNHAMVVNKLMRIAASVVVVTVPHEKRNKGKEIFDTHVNFFDEHSFDFLERRGFKVKVEKTLSPFVVPLRVIAEGCPKEGKGWKYRLYNALCPVFRRLFGVRVAIFLVYLDRFLCRLFPNRFGGLTFVIEKRPVFARTPKKIRPSDIIFSTIKPKS
jgi:SAM-dependent methyltransferase